MTTDIYNKEAEKIGTIELTDRLFGRRWNSDLVHQALVVQEANARKNVAHVKDRSAVSGGGKKPWPQKGTGKSRQGSTRSPLWVGGGVTHGPTKERDFGMKLNKKMLQSAIFTVLSRKLRDGDIKIIDSLNLADSKTKTLSKVLSNFSEKLHILLIPNVGNKGIYAASRNITNVKSLSPKTLNVRDLLKFKNIFIDKDAIQILDEHYHVIK